MPVSIEITSDIHSEIIIDVDTLTPGVLSDDSSESASTHGLQILQQGIGGRQNKRIAKVKNGKLINKLYIYIYIYILHNYI